MAIDVPPPALKVSKALVVGLANQTSNRPRLRAGIARTGRKFAPPLEKAVAMISRALCISLALGLGSLPLAGCVVYEPVPAYPAYYPAGSNFDRAWNAAVAGAQDAGVRVTATDSASGIIQGTRDGIDVVVRVTGQPDGSVRVQFNMKGPREQDPGLSDRFSEAFDRRMGR